MKIIGNAIPNLPWEERKNGCNSVLWRYSGNPIVSRDETPTSNSVFNSAVVPYKNEFAGVFRVDNKKRELHLHAGFSKDGLHWEIEPQPIQFENSDDPDAGKMTMAYDPRVVQLDDRYYITWCNCQNGPTVGMGYTFDFKTFVQIPNALPPYNRNGVLLPRKINGKYYLLHRPCANGHCPSGDIYCSESPDLIYWGKHRLVMQPTSGWQDSKIGAGPIPIETSEGWLLFYHGVLISCSGYIYSMGAVLLELEKPWKVIARSESYLMAPHEIYECVGDVPNVVFPCAALCDAPTGRLAIYYGCADTCVSVAFGTVQDVIKTLKEKQ